MKFLIYSRENISKGVFAVAVYESKVGFGKFKMADPRWRTKQTKLHLFEQKFVLRDF